MDELKTVRWKQRFENLEKAFRQLTQGIEIKEPSDIERQGVIQSFEFTFELSWKTLKDFLESQGVACQFPREVIKQAFLHQVISNGEAWLDMLGKRNLLAHTYDEKIAYEAHRLIRNSYYREIKELVDWLQKRREQEPH